MHHTLFCGMATIAIIVVIMGAMTVVCNAKDGNDRRVHASSSPPLATLAFGSCNKHDYPQRYWKTMTGSLDATFRRPKKEEGHNGQEEKQQQHLHHKVQAFVWLGDVVYADTRVLPGVWTKTPILEVQGKYLAQRDMPEYVSFLKDSTSEGAAIGVWDDHDYGENDGGSDFVDKDAIQQLFLDFLGVPIDSKQRSQKGLYSFHTVPFSDDDATTLYSSSSSHSSRWIAGSVRQQYENAFCVILLDVRYFRDPFLSSREGDMLGEAQWAWLHETLEKEVMMSGGSSSSSSNRKQKQRCAATLIGGGIQFILDEKPTEHWGNFPRSRDRLFSLLKRLRVPRVVFLSGDVHLGEIGVDRSRDAIRVLGYPIVEVTSSGLTHSSASIPLIPGLFLDMFPSPRREGVFLGKNFGSIALEINPNAAPEDAVEIVLRVHSLEEEELKQSSSASRTNKIESNDDGRSVALHFSIPLSHLQPSATATPAASGRDAHANIIAHEHYFDTEPGSIKRILMATQKYVFTSAKFHQLINMYVFGFLICSGVCVLLVIRLLWVRILRPKIGILGRLLPSRASQPQTPKPKKCE